MVLEPCNRVWDLLVRILYVEGSRRMVGGCTPLGLSVVSVIRQSVRQHYGIVALDMEVKSKSNRDECLFGDR